MSWNSCQELEHQIVLLSQQGMSRRAISRSLKVSRNTIGKVLRRHGRRRQVGHVALEEKPKRAPLASKLDPYREEVLKLIERYPAISSQRVYEELLHAGFSGGKTIVKELVRKLRPKEQPRISWPTREYGPGKMAESDWSTYLIEFTQVPKRRLNCFAYLLNYSTRRSYSFHERQDLYALMDGHVQAFERFEGAAESCKYDGQKAVVLRWEGCQPIYNPRFVDFATYYQFTITACRPYHPNDKPHVERAFFELEKSFFNGRSFRDQADLNHQLAHWLDQVCDRRYRKRLKCSALERFALEQPHLRPLPVHPYDTARVVYRLCDLEGCIAWEGNRYEVPYDYVTDILPIRITAREIFVYSPELKKIAVHELRPKGAGERFPLPGRRLTFVRRGPDLEQLKIAYANLGPQAREYLDGLIEAMPRSAAYHARKILALRESYDTAALVAAMQQALPYRSFDYRTIARILMARSTPRRLDEYVSQATARKLKALLAESRTEPRDLTEYDQIPGLSEKGEKPCPESTETQKTDPPPASERPN